MFRGFMPILTILVFGIGIGIGNSWSRGLIPLSLTPAKSGSLSSEFASRNSVPSIESASSQGLEQSTTAATDTSPDDPEIFQNQTEPEIDERSDTTTIGSLEKDRNSSVSATERPAQLPLVDADQQTQSDTTNPIVRTRNRSQKTTKSKSADNSQASFDDDMKSDTPKKVVPTGHQDPNNASSENPDTFPEANKKELSLKEQLTLAEEKLANGETLAAHRDLSTIYWHHKEFRPQIQEIIESTAKAIFFQSKPHYVDPYVIQSGERLEVIAKKYRLSWEYLAKLNQTNPKRIQVGQKLKVVKGPFGAVVDLKDFALTVHLQGYYVKRYDVGIGKEGSSPLGKFAVLNKVENPEYTDSRTGKTISGDDPSNPLGERWIDLGDSYGIHGTIDPNSIGKAESRGCIRLRDNDIIEVYDFLVKGSEVVLRK